MTVQQENKHPLDEVLALEPTGPGRWQGKTSPAYANMVGPFGGTTGATLLNAVLSHEELLGEPISLTVNFAAPVADGPFDIIARPVRTNRSTQHWWVEQVQNDQVVAFATAITALRRETWEATECAFPEVPMASDLKLFDRVGRPDWTRNYDMRFVDGELMGPQNPEEPSLSRVWMRDEPPRPLDFLSLSALCDAFFPRIFIRRPKLVPVGTVSLTTYFHADQNLLDQVGSDHILGNARANRFGKGYSDQSAELWSKSGELLAATHQIVYFRE